MQSSISGDFDPKNYLCRLLLVGVTIRRAILIQSRSLIFSLWIQHHRLCFSSKSLKRRIKDREMEEVEDGLKDEADDLIFFFLRPVSEESSHLFFFFDFVYGIA